ncbi:transglycosylase domain-containing protein [Rummeliibacillus stabekisii]|uniref:Penicillin-binding protein n=1 Tax=Rummeliibacillus stabekisii TaxID=241244 RepID=A0A143HGJ2_9BACL|nr:PBP1A family penicillin-binding protein [Rummeliibacillus stabekisii]AMX00858.1 penicillin-binding protein [Rummeliibacillus stabekisii]MBB5170543.1 1A family penicillin-binding protein [Rummeliibacillus stabekisii]GEL04797.1 penicillin-binding protein 2D [Rummeliibacillus stabekisii]
MNRAEYHKQRKKKLRLRQLVILMVVCASSVITALVSLRVYAQITGAPSLTVPKATVFLDTSGEQIGDKFAGQRRYWVGLDDISPFVTKALIATEDQNFYKHNGFDYTRIAGAIVQDVKAMKKVQGASTITQQYARNLYLSHDKTWLRKMNEALYTYRLETFYDKDQILEGYLNTVYFGHGMYGIEAASRYYFAKPAKELTLPEAASLVAIPKGPSIYSPLASEENNHNRQQLILSLMRNKEMITEEAKERAQNENLTFKYDEWDSDKMNAPYFVDTVWAEAKKILEKNGRNIAEGGWTIQTTLNPLHQKAAEEAVEKNMPNSGLQVGFVSMDPKTGYVTSLVGGTHYTESSYNRVTQAKRQPGSAIKPFLYATALENDFSPITFMDAEKTIFTYDGGRSEYEPKNVNGKFANHPISLAQALAISDNIFAVKTYEEVGHRKFKQMLNRFGIGETLQNTPSVALGTTEVTLKDITSAYNTLAAGGVKRSPITVLSIKDGEGKLIYEVEEKREEKRVLKKDENFILTQLMTGMFDPVFNDYTPATGVSLRNRQTRPYAAKSGTTLTDQMMIGFTPSLTAGVWNGYDQGKQLSSEEDARATKHIWIDFMEGALKDTPSEPFIAPKGVQSAIIDVETGGIATKACGRQRLVYLKKKDMPKKKCTDPSIVNELTKETDETWSLFPFSLFE